MIIVFLGPTLSHKEAQAILPQAYFLPPVKCGDILRVMRLKPRMILIIDGFFEKQAAVWHKEILFALEQNICVLGAASMGALRAAELADFGMIGVGKIFQAYRAKELLDDDEVAVLHESEQNHYRAITDAMINIRATISVAVKHYIINDRAGDCIIKHAKSLFYQERQFGRACVLAQEEGIEEQSINHLLAWVNNGGYTNQKSLDAVGLLQMCKNTATCPSSPQKNIPVNNSIYFRALQIIVSCQPFNTFKRWLPQSEQTALTARLFGQYYLLTQRVAYLIAIISSYPKNENYSDASIFSLGNNLYDKKWQSENDCWGDELSRFIDRLKWINYFINTSFSRLAMSSRRSFRMAGSCLMAST